MLRGGAVSLAILAGGLVGGAWPGWAQAPQQVAVLEGDAPGDYRALGVVSVEVHQKSIFTKTPAKDQLNQALQAEAAKLGADAVIQVKYDLSNPMMSKEGHHATGVAVKFNRSATQMAAAPAAPPAPPAVSPPTAAPPTVAPAAIAPAPAPAAAVPAPATIAPSQPSLPTSTVVVAGAANGALPAPRPTPVTAPTVAAPAVAAAAPVAAPAAPRHTTPASAILVSDQTVLGRAYEQLGEVSVVTHQKSIFTKTPPLETLKSALQAEAAKLGADAIVGFSFKMNNAMTSSKGNHGRGIAVRFTDGGAVPAPASAPAVAAAQPPAPVAPSVAPPAASAQPVAAPPVPAAAAPASGHASVPAAILLTEQDIVGRRYVRLGPVEAVTHQKSIFTKTPPLETLKSALQAEAAKLGADAVIQVKYDLNNPMMSKEGHKATGVAVRFE